MIKYSPFPEVRKMQQDKMYQYIKNLTAKTRIIDFIKTHTCNKFDVNTAFDIELYKYRQRADTLFIMK